MNNQLTVFLTAVMYYTRIPCPNWIDHSHEALNRATMYLPVIGWIVGGIAGLLLWGSLLILPKTLAVLVSIAVSILLTGAFHEDGLADVCDGVGGGWTSREILEVMKDSRIGVFGVIGLILALALKFFALLEMSTVLLVPALVIGHTLSRLVPVFMIHLMPYARVENSKIKPVAERTLGGGALLFAFICGLLPFLLFSSGYILLILAVIPLAAAGMYRYFNRKIGGYTGDVLGCIQQVTEIIIYISILVIWKFI